MKSRQLRPVCSRVLCVPMLPLIQTQSPPASSQFTDCPPKAQKGERKEEFVLDRKGLLSSLEESVLLRNVRILSLREWFTRRRHRRLPRQPRSLERRRRRGSQQGELLKKGPIENDRTLCRCFKAAHLTAQSRVNLTRW